MVTARVREEVTRIAGVPALTAWPAERSPRAAVLLLHGLGGSKEVQRNEAHSLARQGYVAVTLDAFGHGTRRFPDFEERFSPGSAEASFFAVVERTAQEIPAVLAELRRWGAVGGCGISMGGAILFGAIVSGCRFDAAATVNASPRWRNVETSPHQQPERFFPTPLLIQTAGADTVVPPDEARTLSHALAAHYAPAPEKLRYLEHPGEAHMFSAPGWERAWGEVLAWFDRWLAPR